MDHRSPSIPPAHPSIGKETWTWTERVKDLKRCERETGEGKGEKRKKKAEEEGGRLLGQEKEDE